MNKRLQAGLLLASVQFASTVAAQDLPPAGQTIEVRGKKATCPPGSRLLWENDYTALCITFTESGSQFQPATAVANASVQNSTTANPDKNSPDDDCKKSPKTAKPVIIATGEKFLQEFDFTDSSLAGLSLSRTYRSSTIGGRLFGPKWFSNLDTPQLTTSPGCTYFSSYPFLGCVPSSVTVTLPDGAKYQYSIGSVPFYLLPSGGLGNDSSQGIFVIQSASKWMAVIKNRKYVYNPSTKNLDQVLEGEVPLLTYSYSSGKLQSLTSRQGKVVQFIWAGNRVSSVVDPTGNTWGYGYDSGGNLTSVTPPAGTPGARTFHYEDASDGSLLTGVSIDGTRSTRYTYDASKRVLRSAAENGEEFDDFEYTSNTTKVTDQFGQPVTYTFEQAGSFKRLISTDRAATQTCAHSIASQSYDTLGFLASETDWNGTRTEYVNDANGQVLIKRVAVNTPLARRTINTWSGGRILTSTDEDTTGHEYRRRTYTYVSGGPGNGWPSSMVDTDLDTGLSRTVTYSYQFHANNSLATQTISRSLPSGSAVVAVSYDVNGNLTSETNPLGHAMTFSGHNSLGRAASSTDHNGVVISFAYDGRGNVTVRSSLLPTGTRTTTTAYNGWGLATSVQRTGIGTVGYIYSSAGRLI